MAEVSSTKTKKVQRKNVNKKELWNLFNSELKEEKPIERVYRAQGERENCDICNSYLVVSDEGFLACSNLQCGIIYRDILEQGAMEVLWS